MSQSVYARPPETQDSKSPQRARDWIAPRDLDVLTSRKIAIGKAVERGMCTVTALESQRYGFHGEHARAGLLIPLHNTQGEIETYMLRPHDPPVETTTRADGTVKAKSLKYLKPAGSHMHLDVPPSSLATIPHVNVPVMITESPLKADAIASNIEPGSACPISISGVWCWRSGEMPTPDHRDIPWRIKVRDRLRARRKVYIFFDSDTRTNSMVARARFEYTSYLRRLKADVQWIDVPPALDGSKQGIDDALAAGYTMAELIATAYPAPDIAPEMAYAAPLDGEESELEQLRREKQQLQDKVAKLSRTMSSLIYIVRDKAIAPTDKAIAVATLTEAHYKRERGEIEPDGRVRLEARHIANDHRPITPKGIQKPETNRDGSYPLTDRKRVNPILEKLKASGGMVPVKSVAVTKTHHATGDRYKDTEFLVTVSDDISVDLAKLVEHSAPKKPRKAYTWQKECLSCGERHEWAVTCTGCGAETAPRINTPGPEIHVVDDAETEPEPMAASAMPQNDVAKGEGLSVSGSSNYLYPQNDVAPSPPPNGAMPNIDDPGERRRRIDALVGDNWAAS